MTLPTDGGSEGTWGVTLNAHLNIEHNTDGTHKASAMDALIKGWVRFDGTGTLSIKDSFNVSSVTDNGTGDYTINWDTNFSNANYCVVGTCHITAVAIGIVRIIAISASTTRIQIINGAAAVADADIVCVMAIGAQS